MNSPEMLSMHPYDLVDMFQGGLPGAHPVCCSALNFKMCHFSKVNQSCYVSVALGLVTVSPIHILLCKKLYSNIGAICFVI